MLDFYIINDQQPKPPHPKKLNLEYAGGLDDIIFEQLKMKGVVENRYDYYTDFRWNSSTVTQKYHTLLHLDYQNDSDFKRFFILLSKAKERNCGLIAYCD